ncbi:hypothetical protein OUZ56_032924 [Daphnia magna]|uniref:Uncharacterized protein n=1 Tax=Daphnia magna TaxID=35525 RepID=A0ABQ9ZX81_9CRUS|nr:hypothetical protein OUZ56_032924 [Daphnia magna]
MVFFNYTLSQGVGHNGLLLIEIPSQYSAIDSKSSYFFHPIRITQSTIFPTDYSHPCEIPAIGVVCDH